MGMWECAARAALIGLLLASPRAASAEDAAAPFPDAVLNWLDTYVELRQGTDGKGELLSHPAQVLFVAPEGGGKNTVAIDVGLKILSPDWKPRSIDLAVNLAPAVEYHKNTAPENEQDSLLAGAVAMALIGDISEPGILPANLVQVSPKYVRNLVKDNDSFLLLVDYVPVVDLPFFPVALIRGIAGSPPKSETWDWQYLRIWWLPTLGLEFQDVYDAPKKAPTGNETRAYLSLATALYPLASLLDAQLEVSAGYSQWYGVAESAALEAENRSKNLTQFGVTYFFDAARRLGVGVSYSNGPNPRQAKPSQEYWQLSFKAQL